MMNIVVLISGGGSNLQAIIDAMNAGAIQNVTIRAVISNRPDAFGLTRAQNAEIETAIIDHTTFDSREAFDTQLQTCIDKYNPDLIVLAGFMRILTDEFVNYFAGKMLNIHPSLLPKYKGLNTHQRALDAGDKTHGASVHIVTPTLDDGPVLVQGIVPVLPNDNVDTLQARVHKIEHIIYPKTVAMINKGELSLNTPPATPIQITAP